MIEGLKDTQSFENIPQVTKKKQKSKHIYCFQFHRPSHHHDQE